MKKIYSVLILLVGLLVGLQSCEKLGISAKEPTIESTIKYVGYNYVVLDVELFDFEDVYSEVEFHYSTDPVIDYNSPKYFEVSNGHFYPAAVDLIPNTKYFGVVKLQGATGAKMNMQVEGISEPCTASGGITGDVAGAQGGSNSSYLRKSFNIISGKLSGGISFIKFANYGDWREGVSTTYNDNGAAPHPRVSANTTIEVRLADGSIYYSKFGYPIHYEKYGGSRSSIKFCDVVFENDAGDEITLWGFLEAL